MDGEERKTHSRLFEEIVLKSWWLILFLLCALFIYDRALYVREKEEQSLFKKKEAFLLKKEKALNLNRELRNQLRSQNDPAYIELILMKTLGLVPEGQIKVLFVPKTTTTAASLQDR